MKFIFILYFLFYSCPSLAGILMVAGNFLTGDDYLNSSCGFKSSGGVRELYCNNEIVMRTATANLGPNIYPGTIMYFNNSKYEFNRYSGRGALISIKTSYNVFSQRTLSGNYAAYSEDGILDKPVIIVEGYDPDNSSPYNFFYNNGFKQFIYAGRDLFFVNLNSKDKSITENSMLLQKIIQEINGAKSGNHPTAVIGYSMGGIVARKALKNMENTGINHQTSLYVSYDTPHMGANLQGSIERTVERLINKIDDRSFGYTPSALSRARNMYMSPSAQEMLIGASQYAPAKLSDFPVKPVRIAITSGQLQGQLQVPSILDGEQVGYFNMTISTKVLGQTVTLSETSTLYGSKRAGVFYDNVPGSYLYQFDDFINKLSEGVTVSIRQDHRVPYSRKITFIPTLSSLAIARAPTMPAYDLFKFYSPFDKYIAADTTGRDARTVFNAQDSLGSNQRHDVFYSSQLNQLKLALDDYHKIGFVVPDRSFKSN